MLLLLLFKMFLKDTTLITAFKSEMCHNRNVLGPKILPYVYYRYHFNGGIFVVHLSSERWIFNTISFEEGD